MQGHVSAATGSDDGAATTKVTRQLTCGAAAYRERVTELDVLVSARVPALLASGPLLLRLAFAGFGVRLPPL